MPNSQESTVSGSGEIVTIVVTGSVALSMVIDDALGAEPILLTSSGNSIVSVDYSDSVNAGSAYGVMASKGTNSAMPGRRRLRLGRTGISALVSAAAIALLIHASCEAGSLSLRNIFGLNTNEVAVKVATLPGKVSQQLVAGVDFSPDGTHVAVESDIQNISIWDWRARHIVNSLSKPRGFKALFTKNPLHYSPDGRWLALCEGKGPGDVVVRVWNTSNWSIAKDIADSGPGKCDAIAFTPDSRLLIRAVDRVGLAGDTVIAHEVGSWQKIWGLRLEEFSPTSLAISSDSKVIAVGGLLFIRPTGVNDVVQSARQTKTLPTIYLVSPESHQLIRTLQSDAVDSLAWSPDGTRIAAAGAFGFEEIDVHSGQQTAQERIENAARVNVRYTPDGRYLIFSDANGLGTGLGVSIRDRQHFAVLQHIQGDVNSIGVSKDGKYLALGDTGVTTIWQFK